MSKPDDTELTLMACPGFAGFVHLPQPEPQPKDPDAARRMRAYREREREGKMSLPRTVRPKAEIEMVVDAFSIMDSEENPHSINDAVWRAALTEAKRSTLERRGRKG